jgi:glutathione S-transferase
VSRLTLIALHTSPYAARLTIQILHKGLDVETKFPAEGISQAEHGAMNPFARTPILLHGPDQIIESAAIAEYLEDLHPEPGMRGQSLMETARIRAFVRAVDLDLFPLIYTLRSLNTGDPAITPLLAELHQVLGKLEALMDGDGHVCGDQLSMADCALLPACFYLDFFLGRLQQESWRPQHDVLGNWWRVMIQNTSVATVIAGLNEAVEQRR